MGSREQNRQSIQGLTATKKLSKQRFQEAPHNVITNLFGDLVLILSEDGEPLTANVVFIRDGSLCSKDGPAVREDQGDL